MRRLPPLVELRAFEAAARCLSFKKAAAELGVTPTAISHQVKLLEHFCGTPLFRRRPRPLALTPVGEQLYPGIRDGFERIGQALGVVQERDVGARLRISATNAFAAHWLIPRLPHWRTTHPRLKLSIIGTDAVLDLKAGDIDISIRYARKPPSDGEHVELMRDIFYVVASPSLVGSDRKVLKPAELATLPLIEAEWPAADVHAPNWKRWQKAARSRYKNVPDLAALSSLFFREELHAIEAAIAGQGVAICSNVLVAQELASGALISISPITLAGYGFYAVYRREHPELASLHAFIAWARSANLARPATSKR